MDNKNYKKNKIKASNWSVKSQMKILNISPVDKLEYLHPFAIEYADKKGEKRVWELSSRADEDRLRSEIFDGKSYSDGTLIVATDEDKTNLVMLREFRIIAGKYVYTFPAGLIEEGESIERASIREFKEETGMELEVRHIDRERYISVGMSNEKANTVFGYYSGTASNEYQEANEDAEVVIVDRDMAIELLKNEEVTMRSSLILQHYFKLNPFFE